MSRSVRAPDYRRPESDPMAEALNDPEGQALVQAIHQRKNGEGADDV